MSHTVISRRKFLSRGATCVGLSLVPMNSPLEALSIIFSNSVPDITIAKDGSPKDNTIKAIQELGGMERFVKKNNKVVIKPNPVTSNPSRLATTTDPGMVETMIKMCFAAGAGEVLVLSHDSERKFRYNGILAATQRAGSQVVTATSREQYTSVPIYRGRLLKTTEIAKDILDADVFINIPIAKHHRQSDITIGMKNLMGIIWDRGYFHSHGLHQTIADLCTTVKPDLTVVDANRVLITNGPAGPGKIIEAKTVIAGTDPVAVDAWCARYFNKEPQEIGHIQFAYEMGVGELRLNKLNIKEFQVG